MNVSILIPCYNASRWIARAIESAIEQTCSSAEVIVVDDGSTDESLQIIQSFGSAIRWETGPNRGGNTARNRLFELSRGEWLQYLDADDYLHPDKIECQLTALKSADHTDIALCSFFEKEYWENSLRTVSQRVDLPNDVDPWLMLIRWQLPQTGAALWRRSALMDVGKWNVNQPCCQEDELYFRLLKAGKVFQITRGGGAVYRQWSDHTVCKRNPTESLRRRLDIVRSAELHLTAVGQLTGEIRSAIYHARLECARSLYHLDRDYAVSVAIDACEKNGVLPLPKTECFPLRYRLAFRLFGFSGAERLADWTRRKRNLRSTSVQQGQLKLREE